MLRFLVFFLNCVISEKIWAVIPTNHEIDSVQKVVEGKKITAIYLNLGENIYAPHSKVYFMTDFGIHEILIGSKELAGWGISCNQKEVCRIINQRETPVFYLSKEFSAKKAKARLIVSDLPTMMNVNNHVNFGVEVDLICRGNKWNYENWGVVGLAPYGTFVNYIRSLYSPDFSIMVHYIADKTHPSQIEFNSRTFLNPHFKKDQVVVEVALKEGDQFWTMEADLDMSIPVSNFKNKLTCISNSNDSLFLFESPINECNEIKKLICKGKIDKECKKENADFSLSPVIHLLVKSSRFDFTHIDYLYLDETNIVQCRFDSIYYLRTKHVCHPEVEFGLGKLFYDKFPIILNFIANKRPSMIFLNKFRLPDKKTPVNIYYWTGVALVIIGIVFFISIILIKKKESDAKDYPEYESQIN